MVIWVDEIYSEFLVFMKLMFFFKLICLFLNFFNYFYIENGFVEIWKVFIKKNFI